MSLSGYRAMWVLVMFDLPVRTKVQRKRASGFRKDLIQDGFMMVQYSIYSRPCPTMENADVHVRRVKAMLPPEGEVRILLFTDKQYGMMERYRAGKLAEMESQPEQIMLF